MLILVVFVLVVGPADFYLLGVIRQRRWTWVAFPVMSIVFTVATVVVANEYRGRVDARAAINIHDIGELGRVLKRTRLELVLPASRQTVTTEMVVTAMSRLRMWASS